MSETQHPSPAPRQPDATTQAQSLQEREELKRIIEELRRVDQLRSDLVSMVSHELRTPLATIKEFRAILSDGLAGPLTPDQQAYLKIIQENVERMVRLVDDLLDCAKLEAGHVFLNKRVVEAGPLVEHVVKSMKPLADGKQLRLEARLPKHAVSLFADSDKVTQVLMNLAGNAIKFTQGPGRVVMAVEELPDHVQFQVTDTGIGIATTDLPKLFEKFQQLSPIPSLSGPPGTGLGLAISKRLVELHGGRIWAESRVGSGSVFTFTLPKYHLEEVLHEYLKSGVAQAQQRQGHFSIVVLGVVEFTALKERLGADATAQLLKGVEQVIEETIRRRAGDVVVRWQRGEVLVVLAEVDQAGARVIAERLKRAVEGRPYRVNSAEERVTVAASSVTYPEEVPNDEELLRMAEQRLQHVGRPKSRILVVDDEPKIRHFLKEVLELRDFEVLSAASGPEALECLKTQLVDLILLDLMMPVMDGYEICHLLKENSRTRDIPVLIVTAKGERTDRLLGIEESTYNYVMKPFELEELLAKVHELLRQTSKAS